MAKSVVEINSSLEGSDPAITLEVLKQPQVCLRSITDECAQEYHQKLCVAKEEKKTGGGVAGWADYRSKEGHTYYYNDKTEQHSWVCPEEYAGCPATLTREEIQVGVVDVIA